MPSGAPELGEIEKAVEVAPSPFTSNGLKRYGPGLDPALRGDHSEKLPSSNPNAWLGWFVELPVRTTRPLKLGARLSNASRAVMVSGIGNVSYCGGTIGSNEK